MPNEPAPLPSSRHDVDAFLAQRRQQRQIARTERGRLPCALDATASREPMWALACQLQSEMFKEVAAIGSLDVQLIHYRGVEFEASPWVSDAAALADLMAKIECVSGYTQIAKVLAHVRAENAAQKVSALVFVGDAVEEEPAELHAAADGLGVPVFMFLEGDNSRAAKVFQEIARRTPIAASMPEQPISCAIYYGQSLCTRLAGCRPCRPAAMPAPSSCCSNSSDHGSR